MTAPLIGIHRTSGVRRPRTHLLLLMIAAALFAPGSPALAASPGRNGIIAYSRDFTDRDGSDQVATYEPSRHRGGRTLFTDIDPARLAPSWSPNGRELALGSTGQRPVPSQPQDQPGLVLIGSDGSRPQFVPNEAGGEPTWSPDAGTIVYTGSAEATSTESNLFLIGVDGSGNRQLTFDGASEPAWSSAGEIAYVHDGDIYLIRPDGTHLRRLTFHGGNEPDFSPRGRSIVFDRRAGRHTQLFLIGTDGRVLRQLTRVRGAAKSPAFSPDGRWIAFIHETAQAGDSPYADTLTLMRSSGRDVRAAHPPYDPGSLLSDADPSWQPLPSPGR